MQRGICVCSKTRFCFAKPLAPPAKDSLRSSFVSGRLSRLWRSILALRARGLFLTDRVKPSLWQRLLIAVHLKELYFDMCVHLATQSCFTEWISLCKASLSSSFRMIDNSIVATHALQYLFINKPLIFLKIGPVGWHILQKTSLP